MRRSGLKGVVEGLFVQNFGMCGIPCLTQN